MALEVFSDMSERLNYNLPGFPIYAWKWKLCQFDRYAAPCHWHPDLEFIYVLDGTMDYFVNGQILGIGKDEGIFVNSKRLHYGFSDDSTDCLFITTVIHPAVLGENIPMGKTFFETKFSFETEDYILLKAGIQWQKEILTSIKLLFDEMHTYKENPLRLLSLAASLCACTADNLNSLPNHGDIGKNTNSWIAVRNMTGFIFKNYGNTITLDKIAAAGAVCRSKCCQLFDKHIGQTPNSYLTGYRIGKSCEMLRESNMSVLEVATACGFQSPSYFTQVFQKKMGLTPKEYRNKSKI